MRKFKKCLICIMIFGTTFLVQTTASFAAELENQSHDVVVGKVDKNNTNDTEQDIRAPETGIFGLSTESAAVIIPLFCAVPIAAVIIFLLKRTNKLKH